MGRTVLHSPPSVNPAHFCGETDPEAICSAALHDSFCFEHKNERLLATALEAMRTSGRTNRCLDAKAAELANMCSQDQVLREVLASKPWVISYIASTLMQRGNDERAVRAAASALRRLLALPSACASLFKARGFDAVISLLRNSRSEYVVGSAVVCLSRLASPAINGERAVLYSMVLAETAAPALLVDVLFEAASPATLEAVAAALAALSGAKRCQQALVLAGGVDALAPFVNDEVSSPHIQCHLLATLSNLASGSAQQALRVAGRCASFLANKLAQEHGSTSALAVQVACARLLSQLSTHEECLPLLARAGVVHAVTATLERRVAAAVVHRGVAVVGELTPAEAELEASLAAVVCGFASQKAWRKDLKREAGLFPALRSLAADGRVPNNVRDSARSALRKLHPIMSAVLL